MALKTKTNLRFLEYKRQAEKEKAEALDKKEAEKAEALAKKEAEKAEALAETTAEILKLMREGYSADEVEKIYLKKEPPTFSA